MLVAMRMSVVKSYYQFYVDIVTFLYFCYTFNYLLILLFYLKWNDTTKIMFVLLFINAAFFFCIHYNFTFKIKDFYKPFFIYALGTLTLFLSLMTIIQFPLILKIISKIIFK